MTSLIEKQLTPLVIIVSYVFRHYTYCSFKIILLDPNRAIMTLHSNIYLTVTQVYVNDLNSKLLIKLDQSCSP